MSVFYTHFKSYIFTNSNAIRFIFAPHNIFLSQHRSQYCWHRSNR